MPNTYKIHYNDPSGFDPANRIGVSEYHTVMDLHDAAREIRKNGFELDSKTIVMPGAILRLEKVESDGSSDKSER